MILAMGGNLLQIHHSGLKGHNMYSPGQRPGGQFAKGFFPATKARILAQTGILQVPR